LEEKWEEVLKQYDFEVKRILWARGAKLLETDRGLFQMKQFTGKPRQLALEHELTFGLEQNGQSVDSILKTKEGLLYALGAPKKNGRSGKMRPREEEDGNEENKKTDGEMQRGSEEDENMQTEDKEKQEGDPVWWKLPFPENQEVYVLRKWFPGEEGNFREAGFLKRAASSLGTLHNKMEQLEIPEDLLVFHPSMRLLENWQKHNRELKRIRRYILNKKQKNEFEVLFLSMEEESMETAQRACTLLQQGDCRALFSEAAKKHLFCHGNYNYHNLLDTRRGIVTVCFGEAGVGVPVFDLYQMIRKLLEKNRWDKELLAVVLKEYEKQRHLTGQEKELLSIMLLYPEKFWKVSNHYYNSRKSWINRIDIAKLEELGRQREKRQEILEYLRKYR
jgi:CotS family spore coat protein